MSNVYKTIDVSTKERDYSVIVGRELTNDLKSFTDSALEGEKSYDKVFFVSDSNVWPLWGDVAVSSFINAGVSTSSFTFEAGEKSKKPPVLVECLEEMARFRLTRDSLLVTLGGGVACDLGGFAAATYMRGIRVLQVPTSLLACVDASVGGKTAVDLEGGKNMFGAFHQPVGVVCDIDCLETLSEAQFQDALGEVVKHSILADGRMFEWLCNNKLDKSYIKKDEFLDIVAKNIEIKRNIVCADEQESSVRQTLNLGHTIGHAIETACGYELGHGSCVAIGTCVLARGCARLGIISDEIAKQIICGFAAQGLPTVTECDKEEILELMKHDKKTHGDTINLVIPREIGQCVVEKFSFVKIEELLSNSLNSCE